ncbi:hypothetical protein [uncultured Brachyspira sp.]|uniref:hypothetical protein n=1 Tax=uncultured Brachyspira sp. TaxID=221953 RepID=UPI00261F1909|nr:hypothetical protein [uncultured Brachyspira sp.]
MKKFIFLFVLIITISSNAFSQLGFFSLGYILPLGGSLPSYYIGNQKNIYKSQSAFEVGLLLQPTYNFILGKNVILGLGMDLGYQRDSYRFIDNIDGQKYTHVFDSLNIGGYFETMFARMFMVGLGGGVKVPLGGSYRYDYIIEVLNYSRLKSRFDTIVIPYIKFLVGMKTFVSFSGISLSFYVNYDFPVMKYKRTSVQFSSVDLGVQIGLYFSNLSYE